MLGYIAFSVLAVLLYLPKLIGFRYAFKREPHLKASAKRKISVIIPARDESKVIGDLFASLAQQTYDRAFFTVNVIVKDADDPTIPMATAMGARVYVVPSQTCKGDALDGYFKALTEAERTGYDAFVIVDADAVLDRNYIAELNNALEADFDIYLTRKHSKNLLGGRHDIWSDCSTLTWPILDDLGNRFRMRHAMPLNMCGQGMMVRRRLIEDLGGWPYRTLTEDYELKLDSLLKGYRSMFYPYAELYTEEALGHAENYTRRLRWLTGYKQCDKKYHDRIREQARTRGYFNAGEFEYFFGIFPLLLFAVSTAVAMVGGIALTAVRLCAGEWQPAAIAFIYLTALPFFVLYILLFLYSVLAMFACGTTFRGMRFGDRMRMLLYNPFFLLEYIPLYLQSGWAVYTDRLPDWKHTERIDYGDGDKKDKDK